MKAGAADGAHPAEAVAALAHVLVVLKVVKVPGLVDDPKVHVVPDHLLHDHIAPVLGKLHAKIFRK